ncbi:hypothetical protein HMPREF0351_11261 [Enterococcus faecium DO]|uniref:Uncharacterized protein n=1 Tax=Enterococcus faecium (strain ATCC BAA-472 / TX0016 / DO) TaxID=333849 RepID=I3U1J7_ENTFD|nr:hypothetical protein HMPREF0351_11261 [Enterococcus faecium DO]
MIDFNVKRTTLGLVTILFFLHFFFPLFLDSAIFFHLDIDYFFC